MEFTPCVPHPVSRLISKSREARNANPWKFLALVGVPVADVLQRLGAHLERGTAAEELDDYSGLFDNTDPDRDGNHTWEEYVENGRYLTPQARAGIFSSRRW